MESQNPPQPPTSDQSPDTPTSGTALDKKYLWSEELNTFVVALDSYQHTIPESVILHYLHRGGVAVLDSNTVKMIGICADKFLAETLHDASQFAQFSQSAKKPTSKKRKAESKSELRSEDLERALAMRRIFVKIPKPQGSASD